MLQLFLICKNWIELFFNAKLIYLREQKKTYEKVLQHAKMFFYFCNKCAKTFINFFCVRCNCFRDSLVQFPTSTHFFSVVLINTHAKKGFLKNHVKNKEFYKVFISNGAEETCYSFFNCKNF